MINKVKKALYRLKVRLSMLWLARDCCANVYLPSVLSNLACLTNCPRFQKDQVLGFELLTAEIH